MIVPTSSNKSTPRLPAIEKQPTEKLVNLSTNFTESEKDAVFVP